MKQCTSLAEVRTHIDALDEQLVALLAQRQAYVAQAVRFKTEVAQIAAPERAAAVVAQARTRAVAMGASPDVVEAVYRAMIGAFIAHEHEVLSARSA